MSIITVKSQEELDMIPIDTEDIIRIEFGTCFSPAIVRNRYKHRVVAWENSTVTAWENSTVTAWENSTVTAWENSTVTAWENSTVTAWENSTVTAWGNVQVVDYLQGATITLNGNARAVYMPKTIEEFMNFYGIRHDKTTAIFYKAVHKIRNEYVSDYDPSFKYVINRKAKARGFDNSPYYACAAGIHISHLDWALNYGQPWLDLAIIEVKVKIKDIVLPNETDGKVRVPEAEVIREVPLEECGAYGKILAKRREREVSHG